MQSALLFYKKLHGELENYGFEVNPYDPCVANKIINGTEMTVTWHVDDLKVSYKDDDEILASIYPLPDYQKRSENIGNTGILR